MTAAEGGRRLRRVGLLGAGIVGGGVIELLGQRGPELGLSLARVAVQDLARARPEVPAGVLVGTVDEVVSDPAIDVVVEVIGGREPALSAIRTALECRKDVVTANKLLVAEQGPELLRLAEERGVALRFEASVAGCLPIVEIIESGLIFDRVERLFGILNGTTNFILTRCQREGLSYPAALELARKAGFAEADPSLDVSGADTAQKLAILATLLTGRQCPISGVATRGIEALVPEDHVAAEEVGTRIKLLATYAREGERAHLRVAPTLVPEASALGLTTDEYNAVEVECTHIGWQLYLGKGAGRMPTASAVLHDLASLDATRSRARERRPGVRAARTPLDCVPGDIWRARWLVRLPPVKASTVPPTVSGTGAAGVAGSASSTSPDPASSISRIGAVFAAHGVEILEYRRSKRPGVGAIVLVAPATEAAISAVARQIASLDGAAAPPVVLAMEPDA